MYAAHSSHVMLQINRLCVETGQQSESGWMHFVVCADLYIQSVSCSRVLINDFSLKILGVGAF